MENCLNFVFIMKNPKRKQISEVCINITRYVYFPYYVINIFPADQKISGYLRIFARTNENIIYKKNKI